MQDTRTTSVKEYLRACEVLRDETGLAMRDLHARSEDGVEIRYLVDFSEIFAFAFPQQTLPPMRVFGDEDALTTELLQRDALHNLFFRSPSAPVIIPPYAIELQTQLARLRVGYFDDIIREMTDAARVIERSATNREVQGLVAELQKDEEFSPDQLRHALRIFEDNATALVLLHQYNDGSPYDKVMRLVRQKRLVPLQPALMHVEPDAETRERWYEQIFERRMNALPPDKKDPLKTEVSERSYIDASAIGLLFALNRQCAPAVRFLFVTRSSHMHRMFDAELKEHWDGEDVFRHPRSFSSLFLRHDTTDGAEELSEQELKQSWDDRYTQLQNRHASLDLFIEATRPRLAKEPLENDGVFLEQIAQFRRDWELSGILAASPGRDVTAAEQERVRETRRRVMDVVRLLTKREAFSEILEKRLDQLVDGLERGHEFLGFYAQSSTADERGGLENAVRTELVGTKQAILASRRYWVPHTLEFTSPELTQWARALEQKSEIAWSDITDFLRESFSREAEYERLLAMAYLMASIKKWDFAERFCKRALVLPSPALTSSARAQILRYEGHFFLAVCFRMHRASPERHREALFHLQKASALRAQELGVKKSSRLADDPRYLVERGNHIYKWNAASAADPQPPPSAPITAALECWQRALELAEQNPRLQAQIHNNICFYYSDAARLPSPDYGEIRHHLDEMIRAQRSIDSDLRRWPPVFLHTIAVARHLLYSHSMKPADLAGLRAAAVDLKWVLEHADLLDIHKRIFDEHLKDIDASLKGDGTSSHSPAPAV